MRSLLSQLASWPARALIGLVRFYQATFRGFYGHMCGFHPKCSDYFIEAVQKYGAVRGGLRGVYRILRCHPLQRGGFDPP